VADLRIETAGGLPASCRLAADPSIKDHHLDLTVVSARRHEAACWGSTTDLPLGFFVDQLNSPGPVPTPQMIAASFRLARSTLEASPGPLAVFTGIRMKA